MVTNTAPPDVLDAVTSDLRSAADTLSRHVPADPVPRFMEPPQALVADTPGAWMDRSMPYDPVVGRFNPIALPVEISFQPPLAIGTAVFTTPYEGGPGWVHGAALAATFDIVLTAANYLSGAAGPTVWLTIRFRRPTLVGIEARFEAEVVANDGRRVTSKGRLVQDGVVCVEAEGEFVALDKTEHAQGGSAPRAHPSTPGRGLGKEARGVAPTRPASDSGGRSSDQGRCGDAHHGRRRPCPRLGSLEGRVAEGEHPTVGADHPVALARRGRRPCPRRAG